eukprot:Blabericola_migrator_1__9669@NODE_528_length_7829_cov_105_974749_g403_i0_p7_GENE_NODE_528_length_7829_cov_105_974749_g403_i0NODE_528_length_7829_cov_105_974749_g403_i0_p7_ORF_typecomplete_len129_score28_68UPF0139/PF03669_13/0_0011DUF4579/PF15158_6/0_0019DUF4579/PF15158_6/7_7e02ECFribofla_trS/PF07155_12/0_017DUF5346/PF17281_2/2_9_NODE_528_length_7829_cov_105_974749_g403_i026903076
MFEDEPQKDEGKWEKTVEVTDDDPVNPYEQCKDESYCLDYRSPDSDQPDIWCTVFTALTPLCAVASSIFKMPTILYLCPVMVMSAWSVMRNGQNKTTFVSAMICAVFSIFNGYQQQRRLAEFEAVRDE